MRLLRLAYQAGKGWHENDQDASAKGDHCELADDL
jgi:hypothetical protein